jgi:hypothetical protein
VLAGLPEHERGVTLGAGSPGIADAPEPGIDVVLCHCTSSPFHVGETRYGERGGIQDGGKQWSDLEGEFLPLTA